MPFDPKLIHQAEAPLNDAGDLALPDDLLELATQLGDDAQHLAKVYPAVGRSSAPSYDDQSIGLLSAVADDATVGRSSAPSFIAFSAGQGRSTAPSYDPNVTPTHLRRTSRRLLRAVALVASLAAVIVGVTLWYPREENQPQPRNLASSPERSATAVTHTGSTDPQSAISNQQSPPASPNSQSAISNPQSPPPAAPPPPSRDTFLHEYSGPELEGIYDLIGDSEDDKISI